MNEITVGVLTISDRCYNNEAVDESGPTLVSLINQGIINHGRLQKTRLVPDSRQDIEQTLRDWCKDDLRLILTTGGTGLSERDVTPEATMAVLEKTVPGIAQLMFQRSLQVTPLAALSRAVAGVRARTLIINLPGSKKASRECLEAVAGVIPHAIDLIACRKTAVEGVHAALKAKESSVVTGRPAHRRRESPYPCISVAAAQEIVLRRVEPMARAETVSYENALGHVLAESVTAQDDLPPFDASLKDGYAVRSADGATTRTLLGVLNTGDTPLGFVSPGCCMRVSTGGPIPAGADSVVPVEDTGVELVSKDENEEALISVMMVPKKGSDIRTRGSDFQAGQMLLSAGTYLDSAGVGLLAAAGVTSVRVTRKPVVAIMSTGDEVVVPEEKLKPGKIRDSNRITLMSLLKEEHFKSVDLGIVRDEPNALRDALERGFGAADVIVTSGSMSMGERDYLKEVLESDFGAEICFGRVWMKPGKPTSFGIVTFEEKKKVWFGLPGNPASAVVTSHLFVLPALKKMSGRRDVLPGSVEVAAELGSEYFEERPHYVRGIMKYREGSWQAWPTGPNGQQRSSRVESCVNANCLLVCTRENEKVNALPIGKNYF